MGGRPASSSSVSGSKGCSSVLLPFLLFFELATVPAEEDSGAETADVFFARGCLLEAVKAKDAEPRAS